MAAWSFLALALAGALCWAERRRRRFSHFPSLQGKHVVITGGSSGIGLCIAKQCAAEGACVTIMARSVPRLEEARRVITSSHDVAEDSIRLQSVDVGDAGAVAVAIHDAFAWRPIDVLVCSAGILEPSFFADIKPSSLEKIARTNILGVIFPVQSVIPLMQTRSKEHPSSIVIVNSLAACICLYGTNMYSPSKAAVKAFADLLKFELLPWGIGVTVSYPSFTETPMFDAVAVEAPGLIELGEKMYLSLDRESPEEVARCTIEGFRRNEYFVSTSYKGLLVQAIGRGFVAPESFTVLLLELILIIPSRILSFLWVRNVKHILVTNPVVPFKKIE